MKKFLSFTLAFSLLLPSFASTASAQESSLTLNAESAILYNPVTKEILYEKNADKKLPPASLTKIMTMALATEEMKKKKTSPDEKVTISEKAWLTGGSKMFLTVGKEVPIGDIFKGIAIDSGNDAAVAIAEHLNGSTDNFVTAMNDEAKKIGMTNTHFTTVNGLSDPVTGDSTTARDLLKLSNYYVHKYPENMKIHSTKTFTTPRAYSGGPDDITQTNHNPLLGVYKGVTGLKTGFIATNYNIVATVKRGKQEFIAVVLNAKSDAKRQSDIFSLLDYGFAQYQKVVEGQKGEEVTELTVFKSKNARSTKVALAEEASLVVNVKDLSNVKVKDKLPKYLTGGKKAGEKIGTRIITDGKHTAKYDIVLTEDLDKAGFISSFFDSIAMWFTKLFL